MVRPMTRDAWPGSVPFTREDRARIRKLARERAAWLTTIEARRMGEAPADPAQAGEADEDDTCND